MCPSWEFKTNIGFLFVVIFLCEFCQNKSQYYFVYRNTHVKQVTTLKIFTNYNKMKEGGREGEGACELVFNPRNI